MKGREPQSHSAQERKEQGAKGSFSRSHAPLLSFSSRPRASVVVFLRTASEAAILLIFLAVALVVILRRNPAAPTDMEGGSAEEHVERGNRIYAAGRPRFSDASIQYWEAIRQNQDIAEAHFKLATIYYEYIWNHDTLRELDEVERIDPNYPGLYLLRGKVYHRMPNTDEALKAFQRAVALQPENSEAHYYLGTIYQQRRMLEEAISEYEKAIAAQDAMPSQDGEAVLKAHLQLGRIYKEKKEREKAKNELREALSMNPASDEVISELRNLYRQDAEDHEARGEYDKAAESYEEMIRVNPNDARNIGIYMKLGNIYRSNEIYDKAAVMYEAVRKLDPLNFDAFSALKELEILRSTSGDGERE